jgi:hypothetical protein
MEITMADEQLDDLAILEADSKEQETDLSELGDISDESSDESSELGAEDKTEEKEDADKDKDKEGDKKEDEEPEPDEEEKLAQGRLTFKQITEKFPTLFKEFPQLRHTFFREQEYAKVFPTVEDAQEAASKAENYSYLESDLLTGNSSNLLLSISKANPEAFDTLVDNIIPTIYSVNKDAFYRVTRPIVSNAFRAAFNEGTQTGNKNLVLAAQHLNRFIFGSTDIDDIRPTVQSKQPDAEREKFERERTTFMQQRATEFESGVQSEVRKELNKLASAGLDPENKLSEFLRSSIIDKTIEQIGSVLSKDTRHMATMNSLWKRAMQGGLSPEFKARIIQTHIGRVKELLPTIRAKVRSEALGTSKSKDKTIIKRPDGSSSGTGNQASGEINPRKVDWRKTSDLDILNDNVKLK